MTKKITQADVIKRHLNEGRFITTFEAFSEYGIVDLQAIVFSLKKTGLDIDSEWVYKVNRYGESIKFKKYFLVPPTDLVTIMERRS